MLPDDDDNKNGAVSASITDETPAKVHHNNDNKVTASMNLICVEVHHTQLQEAIIPMIINLLTPFVQKHITH